MLDRHWLYLCILAVVVACAERSEIDAAVVERAKAGLARMDTGLRAFDAGDYERAIAIFTDVSAALPDASHAATLAAFLSLPDAPAYRRLLASVHNNLGLALFRARRFDEAVKEYERAIAGDPSSPVAYRNLAKAHLHQHRFHAALDSIGQAERRDRANAGLLLDKGSVARALGDLELARAALRRVLSLAGQPRDFKMLDTLTRAHHQLGLISLESGDFARAAEAFSRALALDAGFVQARYQLARALALTGDEAAAQVQAERFEADAAQVAAIQGMLSASPGRVEALHYIASTYEALGSYALAATHYRQLLAREPDNLEVVAALRQLTARLEILR